MRTLLPLLICVSMLSYSLVEPSAMKKVLAGRIASKTPMKQPTKLERHCNQFLRFERFHVDLQDQAHGSHGITLMSKPEVQIVKGGQAIILGA